MDMLSDDTICRFNAWTAVVQDAVVLNCIFVGSKVTSHIISSNRNSSPNSTNQDTDV